MNLALPRTMSICSKGSKEILVLGALFFLFFTSILTNRISADPLKRPDVPTMSAVRMLMHNTGRDGDGGS